MLTWKAWTVVCAAAIVACVGDSTAVTDGGVDSGADVTVTDTGVDAPPSCDGGNICGTACVDLQTSAQNCGKCGNACKSNVSCIAGTCGDTIVDVAASQTNACAVRADGKVVCWGANDSSQLGFDPQPSDPTCGSTKCGPPTIHATLTDVAHVALGSSFGCAIKKTDGSVVCWGANKSGQLAALPSTYAHSAAPLPVTLPSKAKSLSLGTATACALTVSGDVYCWGNNATGVTGKADTVTANGSNNLDANDIVAAPNKVTFAASDVTAMAISTGDYPHGCAIRNNDTVWCWGGNYVFELGEWDTSNNGCYLCEATPINIAAVETTNKQPNKGFGGAIAIAVASGASCAVTATNNDVYCWGTENNSQVPVTTDNFNGCSPDAIKQTGLPSKAVVEVQMGNSPVMVRDAAFDVWAWGSNSYGEQADGTHTSARIQPTSIANLAGLQTISIVGGAASGVGLKKDGTVVTWGVNDVAELGHMPNTSPDITCGAYACNPTPSTVTMP